MACRQKPVSLEIALPRRPSKDRETTPRLGKRGRFSEVSVAHEASR
jgi:hypothetical protein